MCMYMCKYGRREYLATKGKRNKQHSIGEKNINKKEEKSGKVKTNQTEVLNWFTGGEWAYKILSTFSTSIYCPEYVNKSFFLHSQ